MIARYDAPIVSTASAILWREPTWRASYVTVPLTGSRSPFEISRNVSLISSPSSSTESPPSRPSPSRTPSGPCRPSRLLRPRRTRPRASAVQRPPHRRDEPILPRRRGAQCSRVKCPTSYRWRHASSSLSGTGHGFSFLSPEYANAKEDDEHEPREPLKKSENERNMQKHAECPHDGHRDENENQENEIG